MRVHNSHKSAVLWDGLRLQVLTFHAKRMANLMSSLRLHPPMRLMRMKLRSVSWIRRPSKQERLSILLCHPQSDTSTVPNRQAWQLWVGLPSLTHLLLVALLAALRADTYFHIATQVYCRMASNRSHSVWKSLRWVLLFSLTSWVIRSRTSCCSFWYCSVVKWPPKWATRSHTR